MHCPYRTVLLDAVERDPRSDRAISIAAVGHESAIRSLRRALDMRVSTIEALCRELDLQLDISAPGISTSSYFAHDAPLRELLSAIAKTYRITTAPHHRNLLLHLLANLQSSIHNWIIDDTVPSTIP